MTQDCLFCRIVAGELPATIVLDSDRLLAFRDIEPQAPTHVLVVPKEHHPTAADLAVADGGVLAEMFAAAHQVAEADGVATSGYRLVFNSGADAHQTVHHAHLHVLGGRRMTWPPG